MALTDAKRKAVLKGARRLLKGEGGKSGWIRSSWLMLKGSGTYWDPDKGWQALVELAPKLGGPNGEACEMCAEGAIYVAAAKEGLTQSEAESVIVDLQRAVYPVGGELPIPHWNDARARDVDEIIAGFDKAIGDDPV